MLVFAVVFVLAVGPVGTAHAFAGDSPADAGGAETLDSCAVITEPGRYVLTENITDSRVDTCIRIRSDDVVLAGRGHRIDGVGAFGTAGVLASAGGGRTLSNVTVRNVTVTDWDDGIRYVSVVDGDVVGTTTADNRVGVSLVAVRGGRVADNVARSNALHGITLIESSANNTLANNTATGNALFGISLVEGGVTDNRLVSNVASNNEFGIVAIGVRDNVLAGNVANGNRIAGVWLSAAHGNRLVRNRVSNRFYGVFLADGSEGNVVTKTVAVSNRVGIRLRSSDGNRVTDNVVRNSSDTAILLISSDDNVVVGNVGWRNAREVVIVRSTGNLVTNNSLSG